MTCQPSRAKPCSLRLATFAAALAPAFAACAPWAGPGASRDSAEPVRAAGPTTLDERPNIVLILADDLGYECLNVNGGESYETPHLDRMAAEGVNFTRCHSTPLCTPSRVQLMTGRYSFRNYVRFGFLDPDEVTFARRFKDAGYDTAITGKWQLTYGDIDPQRPAQLGFDGWCLWNTDAPPGSRYADPRLDVDGELRVYAGAFGPDLICDHAVKLIEEEREAPLFLYYPMVLPHSPFVRPPEASEGVEGLQAKFAAMVGHMDSLVGRVLDAAASSKSDRETLVLFVGDNGTDRRVTSRWRGAGIVGGKSRMNTHGTHVPLIAWWPGRAAPAVCEDLVDFTDFVPTLCEGARIPLPESELIDGVSFLPRLLGQPHEPREWIFCHYDPRWNVPGKPGRFAQDEVHRLHQDGRLIHLESDPLGEHPVEGDGDGSRQRLKAVLDSMPPWQPPARARRPGASKD